MVGAGKARVEDPAGPAGITVPLHLITRRDDCTVTVFPDLCAELKISRATLYRYVSPKGELRDYGQRALSA